MSKGAGTLVLAAGIAGLGFWGRANQASDIEAVITAEASSLPELAIHDIDVAVSGRDILLTGTANSPAEAASLIAAANEVTGRRTVHSQLTVIPARSPYTVEISKDIDGAYDIDGAVPTEAVRTALAESSGIEGLDALEMASGATDGYEAALTAGLSGLTALEEGQLTLQDGTLTLTGLAPSQDSLDALTADLEALPDSITVANEVQFIPTVAPFTLEATKGDDGAVTLSGFVTSEQERDALAADTGLDTSGLQIARGAPEGWATTATAGLGALTSLATGTLTMSDSDISLTGEAADEAGLEVATAALGDLPDGFTSANEATFTPTASPFTLDVTKQADGALSAVGFTPSAEAEAALELDGLTIAKGAPEAWDQAAGAGLAALGELEFGTLSLSDDQVTLVGSVADQNALVAVQAQLANMPSDFTVNSDITVPVPVADPYTLSAVKEADGAISAQGVMPTASAVEDMNQDGVTLARGAPEGWTQAAQTGMAALGQLSEGRLAMNGTDLTLTGTAVDAESFEAVNAALAAVEGFTVSNDVSFTPPVVETDMSVRYDRVRGLFVDGASPVGVSAQDVTSRLGASAVIGDLSETGTDPAASVDDALDALAPFLSEFESVEMTVQGGQTQLNGELLAEADLDQISARISETGAFANVALSLSEARFENGDTRPNRLSGVTERYTNGFWIPVVEIENPTAIVCDERTRAILEGEAINFVSGSAELDATSRDALAQLAGIVIACFDQNTRLSIIVEGHTDDTGSSIENLRLSNERAAVVRDALAVRGATANRMQATGRGEEDPVADNATEEGRALNRRTVLVWNE